jgi:hypothetical protein
MSSQPGTSRRKRNTRRSEDKCTRTKTSKRTGTTTTIASTGIEKTIEGERTIGEGMTIEGRTGEVRKRESRTEGGRIREARTIRKEEAGTDLSMMLFRKSKGEINKGGKRDMNPKIEKNPKALHTKTENKIRYKNPQSELLPSPHQNHNKIKNPHKHNSSTTSLKKIKSESFLTFTAGTESSMT